MGVFTLIKPSLVSHSWRQITCTHSIVLISMCLERLLLGLVPKSELWRTFLEHDCFPSHTVSLNDKSMDYTNSVVVVECLSCTFNVPCTLYSQCMKHYIHSHTHSVFGVIGQFFMTTEVVYTEGNGNRKRTLCRPNAFPTNHVKASHESLFIEINWD